MTSFFDKDQSMSIIRVPDNFYSIIANTDQGQTKLIKNTKNKATILVYDSINNRNVSFGVTFEDVDKPSILINEKDDALQAQYYCGFKGTCIPIDERDHIKEMKKIIDNTKREKGSQKMRITDNQIDYEDMGRTSAIGDKKAKSKRPDVWDRDELKAKIFDLFGQTKQQTVQLIKQETNASQNLINEILSNIAEKKEGGIYILKSEFLGDDERDGYEVQKKVKTQ